MHTLGPLAAKEGRPSLCAMMREGEVKTAEKPFPDGLFQLSFGFADELLGTGERIIPLLELYRARDCSFHCEPNRLCAPVRFHVSGCIESGARLCPVLVFKQPVRFEQRLGDGGVGLGRLSRSRMTAREGYQSRESGDQT